MTYAYVGLGANSGSPRRQVRHGVRLLAKLPSARLSAVSPFYVGAAQGCVGRQRDYCNAVVELQTRLSPRRLHKQLRKTEWAVQRRRRTQGAPRRLDVDYLSHGAAQLRRRLLFLPHPRLLRRAFVLRPLADIYAARRRPLPGGIRRALARCGGQDLQRL